MTNSMRRFIAITESISNSHQLNHEIEEALDAFPPVDRVIVRDALEMLRDARKPISINEWSILLLRLHLDVNQVRNAISMALTIDCCVHQNGDRYFWYDKNENNLVDSEIDPMLHMAMKQQIALGNDLMQFAKRIGHFTNQDIADHMTASGYPESIAHTMAEHFINQFLGGLIVPEGDGYTFISDKPKASSMDLFKSFLK